MPANTGEGSGGASPDMTGSGQDQPTTHTNSDGLPREAQRLSTRHSIAWRLTTLVTALIAITTIALSAAAYFSVDALLRSSLERQLLLHSQGLSKSVAAFVDLQQERALLVSSRTRLRQLLAGQQDGTIAAETSTPQTERILRDAADSISAFYSIRIAAPDGMVIAASNPSHLGQDCRDDPAFLAGRTDVHLAPPRHDARGFVTILSAPVIGQRGNDLGVVLVETDASELKSLVDAIPSGYETAQVRLATSTADGVRYVLPTDAVQAATAADPVMASALRGERGFTESTRDDGQEVLAAYCPTGPRGWGLVVQVDAAEAYAPFSSLLYWILIIAISACGLALAAGSRLAGRFVQPIEQLSATALAIEGGDFSARASLSSKDEVGVLASAFNHMASSLEGYRTEMQRRVDARTAALEASGEQLRVAKEHAEDANNQKTRFLAGMSHEIRTPMNGIIGMTEILMQSELPPVVRQRIEVVHESGQVLMRLLNDILDLSKVEAGKLTLVARDFVVRDLCEAVIRSFEPATKKKGLGLSYTIAAGTPERLRGDADRLRQILLNLIGNAIKFTEHGQIRMHIDVASIDGDGFRLTGTVSDTGVGIPQDQQAMVFERFHQLGHTGQYVQTGTGLGLTITNKLVAMMGGSMSLESEPGDGSTFSFHVKLQAAIGEAVATPSAKVATAAQKPCNVLLVEDGEVNREVARIMLQNRGHHVIEARDGIEALWMVEHRDIDVVLMDVQMDKMDGWEATGWIRKREQGNDKHLPIIGLSAHAMRGFRKRCLDAGMDDFLSKPMSSEKLYRAVESWCQRAAQHTDEHKAPPATSTPQPTVPKPMPTSPADQPTPQPDTSIRDLALQRVGGMESTLVAIIGAFISEVPKRLAGIDTALAASAAEDCCREAHTLKGAADHMALDPLRTLAARMEKLAADGDLAAVQELVPALRTEAAAAIDVVSRW